MILDKIEKRSHETLDFTGFADLKIPIKAFFHGRLEVYMENKEYEEIEKSADILQKNASNKCNAEIQKAQNYYNGYQQGIEDLLKCIRRN